MTDTSGLTLLTVVEVAEGLGVIGVQYSNVSKSGG